MDEDSSPQYSRKALLQQQQQQARAKFRHQKLKISFVGYVVVLVSLALLQAIGVFLFTKGFLLSRQVLPHVAECGTGPDSACMAPTFDKAVILVIDALRFDFAVPVDENPNQYYHNNLPVLHQLMHTEPDHAVLLKFLADPPTTTLQRLKGLTTGSLPTFIDAGSNFDGDAIDEDNWLLQLHRHGKSVAFMGDDTWKALFSAYINPDLHFPYDSLNVWDLHTVDNGVLEHLAPLMEERRAAEWDVLIGHFLGVDHAGHRYGPDHYAMKDKLLQMNQVIKDTIKKLDDKTLLIVMGDHGMDPTGNHGGESKEELESTIFFYSKSKNFKVQRKEPAAYNTSNYGASYRAVNQIDLVPTLSLLLGLPIPYNNLGFPIDEVFGSEKTLAQASHLTLKQLQRYKESSSELQDNDDLTEKYQFLMNQYAAFGSNKKYYSELTHETRQYQADLLDYCKSLWARFDLVLISLGVAVMILSFSFLATYSRSIPSVRVLTMSFEFIGSIIAMTLLGLVLSLSIFVVLKPTGMNLRTCLLVGSASGITIGFWAPIVDRFSIVWLWHQILDFFVFNLNSWASLGMFFVVLHCAIFASNSYVIWEDKLIDFFLATFGFCCLYACFISSKNKTARILNATHAVTFILLSRLVSLINLCREEQRPYCVPTFKTSWWSIGLLYLAALLLPRFIKSFYMLTHSYHSAAPLWIETGMPFFMLMNAVYWTLEHLENVDTFLTHVPAWLSSTTLKSVKLAIARLVLFIILVAANFSWSRGPLCVKVELGKPADVSSSEVSVSEDEEGGVDGKVSESASKPLVTILGYGNVYGSSYFLFVINITLAILLVSKPLAALSICMLIIQLLSLLELLSFLELRRNLISPVLFGILGYQHYFSTGHQATIPSIQWDVGFMTTETIVFPFTHLNIALNTFGSFLIVCVSVPLITLWRLPPSPKPITVLLQIVTNVTTLLTYQTMTSILSFIFAAHFRRHLMVWKIFAPRFMFSALLLIVFNLTFVLVTLGFATWRVLIQVNRIFGK